MSIPVKSEISLPLPPVLTAPLFDNAVEKLVHKLKTQSTPLTEKIFYVAMSILSILAVGYFMGLPIAAVIGFSILGVCTYSSFKLDAKAREIRIKEYTKIANELEIDLANIKNENTDLESNSKVLTFELNIINWCKEKLNTSEYCHRITAAKKILDCHAQKISGLDLSNLQLTTLPENFDLQNLEWLDLSGNQLEALPKNFNLPNLESLYLCGNQLKLLPEDFNPPKLKCLGLDDNPLEALPENFNPPNLESLYLRGNRLKALPEGFNPPNLNSKEILLIKQKTAHQFT